MGKTEWARSHGSHMYFNTMLNLEDWNSEVDYIILDDFNIEFLPNYKCFFGAQKEFTLTDKYKRKKTVTWGKPLIWLGNQDPTYAKNVDHEWIMANSKIVFIDNKLYLQD
jgi:hypothetical protein